MIMQLLHRYLALRRVRATWRPVHRLVCLRSADAVAQTIDGIIRSNRAEMLVDGVVMTMVIVEIAVDESIPVHPSCIVSAHTIGEDGNITGPFNNWRRRETQRATLQLEEVMLWETSCEPS